MMRPRNPDAPCRGMKYVWRCESDGHEEYHLHLEQVRKEARAYCVRNNYPIGSNWEQQFLDNVCQHSQADCVSDEPPTLAQRLGKFAQAMTQWAKSGFKCVSAEEADRRKGICEVCVHYSGSSSLLKVGCAKCGCSNVKLFLDGQTCPDNRW